MLAKTIGTASAVVIPGVVPDTRYSSAPRGRRLSDPADRCRIFDTISQVVVILLVGNCNFAIAKAVE